MQSVMAQLTYGANQLCGQQLFIGPDEIEVWAGMDEAELARVTQYLNDNDLRHPPMEVTFDDTILNLVDLHVEMKIRRGSNDWTYVIRHIDEPELRDGISYVKCLLVTTTGR
jgi:hypothetical protein